MRAPLLGRQCRLRHSGATREFRTQASQFTRDFGGLLPFFFGSLLMEAVGQAIERTVENTQKLMQVFQNVQGSRHAAKKESGNAETRPQSVQAGPSNSADGLRDSMPDYSGAMAQNIRSERILNMALSQVLALMEGTPVTYDGKGTPFRVEGSDSEAFLLVAEGGGRRLRLDRRLDLNVEFLFEKAGFFTSPYKIDALTVDAAGIVHADVSLLELPICGPRHDQRYGY